MGPVCACLHWSCGRVCAAQCRASTHTQTDSLFAGKHAGGAGKTLLFMKHTWNHSNLNYLPVVAAFVVCSFEFSRQRCHHPESRPDAQLHRRTGLFIARCWKAKADDNVVALICVSDWYQRISWTAERILMKLSQNIQWTYVNGTISVVASWIYQETSSDADEASSHPH